MCLVRNDILMHLQLITLYACINRLYLLIRSWINLYIVKY